MTNRMYTYLTALIGVVCGFVIVRSFLSADSLTLRNDLVQGFFGCAGLGAVSVQILPRIKGTRFNGWTNIFAWSPPGNGIFIRSACPRIFPGPVNLPQES